MIPTWKYDNNQSYLTRCFPARASPQWRKQDSGHWLDSFRKATERTHRHMHRRMKETSRKHGNNVGAHSPCGKTLDAALLLRLRCAYQPAHLCSVDISEQNLDSVNPEDLSLFENLLYIDASANFLSLDSFSSVVSLRELNLTLNGLRNMTFNADDFPNLQVLDLSYNSLSADSITCIGGIPHLKVLHLTGNQLHRLPPDLGFPHHVASRQPFDEENTSFRALEVLLLDDNKLSSEVFNSLKNLKRLKHLNLQGNRISEIPYFPLTGSLALLQTVVEEQGEEDGLASTESNAVDAKTILQQHWEEYRKRSWLPLPNLHFLCLADNKIAEEEALMAVTLFPMICEIDICSNPLTVQKSGEPPLLTHYLQDVLGITVKRKKTQPAVKGTLRVSTHSKSKEDGLKTKAQIPKVPEKVVLSHHPAPVQAEKCNLAVKSTGKEETVQENTELFFLTQATTDAPEYESSLQIAAKNKDEDIPIKPAHYKILVDVKSESDLTAAVGIQTAVWRLEHALRNPKVPRDSEPNLDCIQASRREQQWKVKERTVLTAAKRVDEIMEAVRRGTATREVLLSSAMQGSGVGRQEALLLLRDLRAKYKTLHQKMMGQVAES
ncbi:X-ray radiation resistance-associated protein 1 isoform X2 [Nelusetta ayraudi]|uniref:X-ray radiation resistance-associated protein 1 isoform X2 n=1 Tax=Nelusetta ayraudi TaxID=303726 RepID=UPI003F7297DC